MTTEFWNKFLTSNETKYRLARTIAQGVIGVLIANVDTIVSAWHFSADTKAVVVALVMAILSPIMSELGASLKVAEQAKASMVADEECDENQMLMIEDMLEEDEQRMVKGE